MKESTPDPESESTESIVISHVLKQDIQRHIMSTLGYDYRPPREFLYYQGLAYSMRDRIIENWLKTQRTYYNRVTKRVYYLSMEFLPGRFLNNYITNMQMLQECEKALKEVGFTLEDLEEEEWDAGLGNGGLGRLASCYLDSMASLRIAGYGCGIRYDYGIFHQIISDGYQLEQSDNWHRYGNPWEIQRRRYLYEVKFYGRTEGYADGGGRTKHRWVDTQNVMAMACDILIPGYDNGYASNMRLWAAVSSREFNLAEFQQGDYMGAMEAKVFSENISKVLYPSDEVEVGRELRLKQQYFFVSATFQDIMRRFKKKHSVFLEFSNLVAVQLNDTHPAISIAELMRLLVDEEGVSWDDAWRICQRTFAYTNHTVLPEALETWPVDLLARVLPRHLEIIYEINQRFLQEVAGRYPGRPDMLSRLSIIDEGPPKRVRMAHLAIVGSHSVNGVAKLHTRILKEGLFKEFDQLFPGRIINITNGISHRRWLLQINPGLARLITQTIGSDWIGDLCQLQHLSAHAGDPKFRSAWQKVKRANKSRLAKYILRKTGLKVDPDTLFDIQVKRIHEYKRQLLNILHVITLYNRIKQDRASVSVPRTVVFGGKAAPSYIQAKLIIKLITSVADKINQDPDVSDRLKVVFLPNYCVSQAEKVIPAAELSEQISTAGMEASGTGNMKFALNGALTMGTLDGANIEILEEVGPENMFIFGLSAEGVQALRSQGYRSRDYYQNDPELKNALDMIRRGVFCTHQPGLFEPICRELLEAGDRYLVLADYRSFVKAQEEAEQVYRNPAEWTRRSIINTANMGMFSSDRAVREYAEKIWRVLPLSD